MAEEIENQIEYIVTEIPGQGPDLYKYGEWDCVKHQSGLTTYHHDERTSKSAV
jgi:hypothetical protein